MDLKTGKCIKKLKCNNARVLNLIKLNYSLIASGHDTHQITIWDLNKGIAIKTLSEEKEIYYNFNHWQYKDIYYFSRLYLNNAVYLVSATNDKSRIWDINKGACIKKLYCESRILCLIQLSKSKIVSGFLNKSIKLWDLSDLSVQNCIKTFTGNEFEITALEILNENEFISSEYSCIKIWNISTSKCKRTLFHHFGVNYLIKLNLTQFASCSNNKIVLWDFIKETSIRTINLNEYHKSKVVSELKLNKVELLSIDFDGGMRIWDL